MTALSEEDFNDFVGCCQQAVRILYDPMSPEEAGIYLSDPIRAVDFYNYTDFIVKRIILSLKKFREFRSLNRNDQAEILKVCSCFFGNELHA